MDDCYFNIMMQIENIISLKNYCLVEKRIYHLGLSKLFWERYFNKYNMTLPKDIYFKKLIKYNQFNNLADNLTRFHIVNISAKEITNVICCIDKIYSYNIGGIPSDVITDYYVFNQNEKVYAYYHYLNLPCRFGIELSNHNGIYTIKYSNNKDSNIITINTTNDKAIYEYFLQLRVLCYKNLHMYSCFNIQHGSKIDTFPPNNPDNYIVYK